MIFSARHFERSDLEVRWRICAVQKDLTRPHKKIHGISRNLRDLRCRLSKVLNDHVIMFSLVRSRACEQ
jgi:hypothetical protein